MQTVNASPASSRQPLWQDPAWLRALSLHERAGNLPPAEVTSTALRQLELWQTQRPFEDAALFATRLASDGVPSTDALLALLSEDVTQVSQRVPVPPAWLLQLDEAFAHASALTELPPLALPLPHPQADPPIFLRPFWPILLPAIERLREGMYKIVARWPQVPLVPAELEPSLLASLSRVLLPKVSRTLAMELRVARLRGTLEGATSEERFASYIRLLEQPTHLCTLLNEYTVLARQLVQAVNQWADFHLEWLAHLGQDWETLSTQPGGATAGTLLEVYPDAGDAHRNGRSVVILTFTSGWKLVYKPRSLALDERFQALLGWLNDQADGPGLRQMWIVTRESHGWSEWIEIRECTDRHEVVRFYERLGAYIALLYGIGAKDFHYENVLAAGNCPLLIDLEGVFHPANAEDATHHPGERAFFASILHVGLLSAAGVSEHRGSPSVRWAKSCTDEMEIQQQFQVSHPRLDRPTLGGQVTRPEEYTEAILAGFNRMYRLLLAQRQELIEAWLPRFADVETRFAARPRRFYGLLLFESFHPNQLRNALRRERTLDQLWRAVPTRPFLQQLLPLERSDLLRGDIPLFTTRPASRSLLSSQGEHLPDLFAATGLQRVEQRLLHFSEHDLTCQNWFLHSALIGMTISNIEAQTPIMLGESMQRSPGGSATRVRLLAAASRVGERLCERAVCEDGTATWLDLRARTSSQWAVLPTPPDLYNGTAGVALFLAYLGSLTGQTRSTDLARAALQTVRLEVQVWRQRRTPDGVGAFSGVVGGAIYLLTQLGRLWQDDALWQEAQELVALVGECITESQTCDMLSGSAGAIAYLLNLYAVAHNPGTLAVAIRCGDHLLAQAVAQTVGVGWHVLEGKPPLTGFAHGAAGIVWSLLRLAEVSGQERFRQTALLALAYERSLFVPAKRNWPVYPTFPEDAETTRFRVAWCNGAAGIGLARLASLPYLKEDEQVHAEIAHALHTTLTEGFGRNHSLCHGDFGNLETLLLATRLLDRPDLARDLERISALLLESIATHGWITGAPAGVEIAGLMTGLAGIGYQLLRLADPLTVPSILLLA